MKIVKLSTGDYAIRKNKELRIFGISVYKGSCYSLYSLGSSWSFGSVGFWEYCVGTLGQCKFMVDSLNSRHSKPKPKPVVPEVVEEIDYE